MRYGNATMFCMLAVGVVWGLSGGCGSSGSTSVFDNTGTGAISGSSGTNTTTGGISTGTGSTGAGIMTTGTGGISSGSSTGTGGLGGDACAAQASDSNSIPSDIFIMLDKSGSMNCPAADSACENPMMPYTHPT